MLTFGKSGCCTCRRYRFINYFGVSECIYSCLCYKNFVTYRTMFTFGKYRSGRLPSVLIYVAYMESCSSLIMYTGT